MTRTEERHDKMHRDIATALRRARILRGISQQELGEKTGITYQQIQKYENGKSRITAVRLLHILSILEIPCQDFLGSLPASQYRQPGAAYTPLKLDDMTLKICRRLMAIDDPAYKKRIRDVIFSLAPE